MSGVSYQEFLKAKISIATVDERLRIVAEPHPAMKPHQAACVRWLVEGGRRALFASFGLGKTLMQLDAVRIVLAAHGGRGLIVAPLGVRQEFTRDAKILGLAPRFIRSIEEAGEIGIYLTNYETVRDGKLDPNQFTVCSLDEASCLRGFGGSKTFREFMRLFAEVKFRFVATATPSPNEYIELLAYAAFLGVMEVGEAKTRFFKRNSEKADQLTLHPHKEREFWLWVASWALFVQTPSDLGFSDEGYVLPPLKVTFHEVKTDLLGKQADRGGQFQLLRDAAIGVQDAAREKRATMHDRVAQIMEIIAHERQAGEAAVSARILPKEQGAPAGPATGAGQEELRRQTGGLRSEAQKSSVETVWSGDGHLSGHSGCSGGRLRDLHVQPSDQANGGGSLSPDGRGSGDTLPAVQHGVGPVRGLSGPDHRSSGLPDQIVIWCDLNDEQRLIERRLAAAGVSFSSLDGQHSIEEREALLAAWREKRTSVLLTKPVMYGAGVNLQQSHTMIFAGIGFKAQDFIQALHRQYRFLQSHPVTVRIIHAESEREILRTLLRRWEQHKQQAAIMSEIIREYGLSAAAMAKALERSLGTERVEVLGDRYRLVNADTVEETARMPTNSVGLIVSSIPFSTQYEYTPSYNDFGHTDDDDHFWQQMGFLIPELLRVLKPGRLAAIHVKDRIIPGGINGLGFQTLSTFHMDCAREFRRHGFAYMGMKTITTDVVRENNQTYRLGWTEQCKDGSKMSFGVPEYLMLFRKPPSDLSNSYADERVVKDKKWRVDEKADEPPKGGNWAPREDGSWVDVETQDIWRPGHNQPGYWLNPDGYSRARWQLDAHAFTRSCGNRLLTPEETVGLAAADVFKLWREFNTRAVYEFEHHVKICEAFEERGQLPSGFMLMPPHSPHPDVWTDITRMLSANTLQAAKGKELHLCPLQFDIVDRAIAQWSMKGDVVFDPFGGLMTVPMRAVMQGRIGWGTELNPRYFLDGCKYVEAAARAIEVPSLFDLMGAAEAVAA